MTEGSSSEASITTSPALTPIFFSFRDFKVSSITNNQTIEEMATPLECFFDDWIALLIALLKVPSLSTKVESYTSS